MSELPEDSRAVVITASNRAAAGVYEDRSGQALAEGLRSIGFTVDGPHVCEDDVVLLEEVLREALASGADVVLTTGGTGLSPTDVTPEATRAVLEREAPGIAEAVRRYGAGNGVPTSVLSRGLAGTSGRTLIVNLPGSTGGGEEGVRGLGPVPSPLRRHPRGRAPPPRAPPA